MLRLWCFLVVSVWFRLLCNGVQPHSFHVFHACLWSVMWSSSVASSFSGTRISKNSPRWIAQCLQRRNLYHVICVANQYEITPLICRMPHRVDPLKFHRPLWGGLRAVLVKGAGHRPGSFQLCQFLLSESQLSYRFPRYISCIYHNSPPFEVGGQTTCRIISHYITVVFILLWGLTGKKLLRCNHRGAHRSSACPANLRSI